MNRSLILSNLRIELRKKQADYNTENITCHWVSCFLNDLSIVHANQLERWQIDFFISELKNRNGGTQGEVLQAKSALLFLFNRVMGKYGYSDFDRNRNVSDSGEGFFRITA